MKRAGTLAIMTSYNRLNGTFVSEIGALLRDLVRREWGYAGLFMSDWFGTQSTAPAMRAGLDLEMPGPGKWRRQKLVQAHEAGEVSAGQIREAAGHVLTLMEKLGALASSGPEAERAEDLPETRALIRRAGAEGAVLLKNDGVLPLASPGKIAAIGPNAATARIMGGGSAQLNPHYRVAPLEALKAAPSLHNSEIVHAIGCTNDRMVALHQRPWRIEYFANRDFAGPPARVAESPDGQFMHLGTDAGLGFDPLAFSARLTTTLSAEEDADYAFGVIASGPTRAYVDGAPTVDDAEWRLGHEFFDMACDEMRGTRRFQGRA